MEMPKHMNINMVSSIRVEVELVSAGLGPVYTEEVGRTFHKEAELSIPKYRTFMPSFT